MGWLAPRLFRYDFANLNEAVKDMQASIAIKPVLRNTSP